jgi:MFS transporter, ACS family, tartrate transporter
MAEQDQLFAKCAWRLIPFMGLLYLVSFIDRANVGFAALTMNNDLGFSPAVYGFGAGVFFFGYILFQLPANAMLERVGARSWIFCIVAVWGALSAANAFAQGPASFYALRFLLGVTESGFFPGMIFYLTLWFPQAYLARYVAMFLTAIPLSFIVGGPLASLILGLGGVLGLHGWQWLFLLEGLPAMLVAFAVLKFLPDGPAHASWLSGKEKETIATRLAVDNPAEQRGFWPTLRDPRLLALCLVNFGVQTGLYGVGLWLPQIVQAMGFSILATGFVVALPYLACMGAMILWGRSSDVRGERFWHIALAALVAAGGFVGASLAQSNLLVLLALTFTTVGVLSAFPPLNGLLKSLLSGSAAASGIALYNTIGNLGGFVGSYSIGVLKGQTGNYSVSMAMLAVVLTLSAVIVLALGHAMAPRAMVLPKAGGAG